LWAEGIRGVEIHHSLSAHYDEVFCHSKACISGLTCSEVAKQVLVM